jgi:hypothetical protein
MRDDERPAQPGEPDETRAFGPGGSGGADETRAFPPADAAGTAPLPPVREPTVWSGRAEVPPAGIRPGGQPVEQWEEPPTPGEGGRWWMPIVIGLVALLLLGVLGYGLWLLAAAGDEADPGGTPTPAAPTARPTTAAPTKAAPTTEAPDPTEPAEVQVPPLAGQQLEDAQDQLDDRGLTYRVRFEVTDEQPPGRVVRTEPDAGERVEPGTRVTLVVATAPEESEPPGRTSAAPESPGG